ncbi:MAG: hypothetical protein ACJAR2_000044 [Ilumatobacter sp.]|jgi:hypothetical protein
MAEAVPNEVVNNLGLRPLSISETVAVLEVGGELVLVDESGGWAFALSPIASFVWDGLTAGLDVSAIVDELVPAFDAPVDVITADVSRMVHELSELGVLTTDDAQLVGRPISGQCAGRSEPPVEAAPQSVSQVLAFDSRYLAAPPNF